MQHQIFRFAKMILRDKRSTSWQAQYTTVHHTTPHCTNYTILIAPHHSNSSSNNCNCNCNYTTIIILHDNYNSTTLQLQLQVRYTTLHPADHCNHCTIATTHPPTNTTPITFRSISGFALPSMHHNNSPLL